ncbi:hypothetical protein [Runella sp.]|jgi:hypothetical protein|uniref:hypothetical protein n=1 Tax=Runella sp. TaxID=1960881 RepID=UPI00261D5475|nr:hypothetical protein [Runella sp.]
MKDALMIGAIVAGFSLFFPLLWSGIIYLISYVSGWQFLAAHYKTEPLTDGFHRGVYGRIGVANYNGVLRVAFTEKGMYLHVMPLFKIGHPPLLLPWSQLKEWKESHSFFQHAVKCKIEGISISLPHKYLGTIQSYVSAYS